MPKPQPTSAAILRSLNPSFIDAENKYYFTLQQNFEKDSIEPYELIKNQYEIETIFLSALLHSMEARLGFPFTIKLDLKNDERSSRYFFEERSLPYKWLLIHLAEDNAWHVSYVDRGVVQSKKIENIPLACQLFALKKQRNEKNINFYIQSESDVAYMKKLFSSIVVSCNISMPEEKAMSDEQWNAYFSHQVAILLFDWIDKYKNDLYGSNEIKKDCSYPRYKSFLIENDFVAMVKFNLFKLLNQFTAYDTTWEEFNNEWSEGDDKHILDALNPHFGDNLSDRITNFFVIIEKKLADYPCEFFIEDNGDTLSRLYFSKRELLIKNHDAFEEASIAIRKEGSELGTRAQQKISSAKKQLLRAVKEVKVSQQQENIIAQLSNIDKINLPETQILPDAKTLILKALLHKDMLTIACLKGDFEGVVALTTNLDYQITINDPESFVPIHAAKTLEDSSVMVKILGYLSQKYQLQKLKPKDVPEFPAGNSSELFHILRRIDLTATQQQAYEILKSTIPDDEKRSAIIKLAQTIGKPFLPIAKLRYLLPPEILSIACLRGDLDLVNTLLSYGCSLNEFTYFNNGYYFPLHCAAMAEENAVEIMKVLKEQEGFKVDRWGIFFRTPLHSAAYYGNVEACQYLYNHLHADMNASEWYIVRGKNLHQNTPFHMAVIGGDLRTVKFFIECGSVEKYPINKEGYTPLLQAMFNHEFNSEGLRLVLALFKDAGIVVREEDWTVLLNNVDKLLSRTDIDCLRVISGFLKDYRNKGAEDCKNFFTALDKKLPYDNAPMLLISPSGKNSNDVVSVSTGDYVPG